jgi:hypothetical protein
MTPQQERTKITKETMENIGIVFIVRAGKVLTVFLNREPAEQYAQWGRQENPTLEITVEDIAVHECEDIGGFSYFATEADFPYLK